MVCWPFLWHLGSLTESSSTIRDVIQWGKHGAKNTEYGRPLTKLEVDLDRPDPSPNPQRTLLPLPFVGVGVGRGSRAGLQRVLVAFFQCRSLVIKFNLSDQVDPRTNPSSKPLLVGGSRSAGGSPAAPQRVLGLLSFPLPIFDDRVRSFLRKTPRKAVPIHAYQGCVIIRVILLRYNIIYCARYCCVVSGLCFIIKIKYTPAVRSNILSKLIFASCV